MPWILWFESVARSRVEVADLDRRPREKTQGTRPAHGAGRPAALVVLAARSGDRSRLSRHGLEPPQMAATGVN